MITWELKKMFKSKSGIIALIIFFILFISMVLIKPQLEGTINNNSKVSITAQEQYNLKIKQLKETSKNEGQDEFSKELSEMANEELAAMKFKEYKDVRFWQAFNYRAAHPFMIFSMFIIITILFSNIYTDEIISGMDSLILSSRNKNKVLYSKLAISIGLPIVLYTVYLAVQFIVTYMQYGEPLNGNLQAIRILDSPLLVKAPYTIYEFIMLKIIILLTILITLSTLASLISFITKNSSQSTSAFLIFIFLGKIMTLTKLLPMKLILILSKINYIDLTFHFNEFVGMYSGRLKVLSMNLDITNLCLTILAGTLFIEILLSILTFKKFLTR